MSSNAPITRTEIRKEMSAHVLQALLSNAAFVQKATEQAGMEKKTLEQMMACYTIRFTDALIEALNEEALK